MTEYFRANKEGIATDITRMMGKPIVQSREEVDCAIERSEVLMDLADEALRPELVSKTWNITKTVIREPVRSRIRLKCDLDWHRAYLVFI